MHTLVYLLTVAIAIGYVYDYISIMQIYCKEEGIESTDEALATENKVKTKYFTWLCSYINTIFYVRVQLPIAKVQGNGKD